MKNKWIKLIVILLIIIGVLIIGANVFLGNIEAKLESMKSQAIANIDLTKLPDGSYKGSYKAFPIEAEVVVIIENHEIKNINLLKHKHGQGAAAEAIISDVVEAQSLTVDAVSGATYSSKVILKAIEDALNNAKQ